MSDCVSSGRDEAAVWATALPKAAVTRPIASDATGWDGGAASVVIVQELRTTIATKLRNDLHVMGTPQKL
jgi:hypothetical protein